MHIRDNSGARYKEYGYAYAATGACVYYYVQSDDDGFDEDKLKQNVRDCGEKYLLIRNDPL